MDTSLLYPAGEGAAESLVKELLPTVLPRLAAWTARTMEAVPDPEKPAAGYRDLTASLDGRTRFVFPRSNAAERIECFLWLAEVLENRTFLDHALHYAEAMLDPETGIYQGKEEAGRGGVWYWRDVGLYMTNYTFRVPPAFLLLSDVTGDTRYLDIARLAGEFLLRMQQPGGVLLEGWKPQERSKRFPPPADTSGLLTSSKINSRIGQVTIPFVDLLLRENDSRYADALEKFCAGFIAYQYNDGSFPEDICVHEHRIHSPYAKGHFLHYILNGFGYATHKLPEMASLRSAAVKLADYLVAQFRQLGGVYYGNPYETTPGNSDDDGWHSAQPGGVSGLIYLSLATGNPVYREVASRLILQALLMVANTPENPDTHGGLVWWQRAGSQIPWKIDGYYHFSLILGLKTLLSTQR